jgi:hypothetical protein
VEIIPQNNVVSKTEFEAIDLPNPPSKEENMEKQVSLLKLIPEELRNKYTGDDVIEAGWAAGPSFIVRKTNRYTVPVTLYEACLWLQEYRHMFKACHIQLYDKSVMWLHRYEFFRYDSDDTELRDSGTFIDAGDEEIEVSERLGLSERITHGKSNNPYLSRRRSYAKRNFR